MIETQFGPRKSGLNAELFCGKAAILVASQSQAKLKDFISPIIAGNGALRSSTQKFSDENFILMDELSIFLEQDCVVNESRAGADFTAFLCEVPFCKALSRTTSER